MKIKNILTLSIAVFIGLTMTACFEAKELSGPVVDAQLNLTVLDADGNGVSGATVTLFANRDDYRKFNNALATAPTDASGVAIFSKSDLGTSGLFHYSASVGDDRNWNGSVSKGLTVSNGVSMVETSVAPVTLSTAISGPMQVISSTGETFSINDFPGKYEWSVIVGGDNATIDDPTNNNTNISFAQSGVDYAATIQVVAKPDGFAETTMTMDITVLAFCEYDQNLLAGSRPGMDLTNWLGGAVPSTIHIAGAPGSFSITGLGDSWMEGFWGEQIQNAPNHVSMSVSDDGLFITIPDQYYYTTIYNGDPYDYNIIGSGSVNGCTGEVTLYYDMVQDGFSTAGWASGKGYLSGTQLWEAKVTFTP